MYYELASDYVHANRRILELAGAGRLVAGRVVVLRDSVGALLVFHTLTLG